MNTDCLGQMLERLVVAAADTVGLLGSIGAYAYVDATEREQVFATAAEVVIGRVPLIVRIGALRTDWAMQFAQDAEKAGIDGLPPALLQSTPPSTRDAVAQALDGLK